MLRPYQGFVGPAYRAPSKIAADDRCVNWVPSKIESGTGPASYVYDPAPGYRAFVTLPEAPTRGFFTLNGGTFAVGGTKLYEITITGVAIERATGLSNLSDQPVRFACNGDAGHQLAIVSDSSLYVFDLLTNVLTVVNGPIPSVPIPPSGGPVSPSSGTFNPPIMVTLTGTGFTGATVVNFRIDTVPDIPLPASSVTVVSDTTITCIVPGPFTVVGTVLLGPYDVEVVGVTTFAAAFSYVFPTPTTPRLEANVSDVVFQDGYFIALDPSTSSIYLSAQEDGLSWDPLDVAQRNDSPDKWVKMIVRPKEVWLFGSESTSVYYDSGDAGFPYVPNPSVSIAYGTSAPASVALLYSSPIWLANDLTVRYANGYTPERISTHAIEYAISQYATVSNADATTYTEQGHAYYVLTFPGIATWVYDFVTGLWHERGAYDGLDFTGIPVWGYTFAFNTHLVGSRTTGIIYEQLQDVATDIDGVSGLRRVRLAPHVVQSLNRIRYSRFRLHMEVGVGLTTGQGSDPQVMLRWSNDGGQSFGAEYLGAAGALGAYGTLVDWWQLGQGRDRVYEVSVSDPIPWRLVQAFFQTSPGPS